MATTLTTSTAAPAANSVYASTLMTTAETQNFLALALVLGVLGIMLTNNRVLARTISGVNGLFSIESQPQAQPQASSSRA